MLFYFTATATTEIYTLSLHDALPISQVVDHVVRVFLQRVIRGTVERAARAVVIHAEAAAHINILDREPHLVDRKSTRLNSSHVEISYAVFCLKKKIYTKTTLKVTY